MYRKLQPGDHVWFLGYKRKFTVRASSDRYKIVTKPENFHRSFRYSIIDCDEEVCGPSNHIFGDSVETDEECLELLNDLMAGECEVSSVRRRGLELPKPERLKYNSKPT